MVLIRNLNFFFISFKHQSSSIQPSVHSNNDNIDFVSFWFFFYFVFRVMITKSDIRSSCRIVPGLSREQLDLCYKASDVTLAALDGLDLAIRECQLQVH